MSPEGYDGGGGRKIAIIGTAILIIGFALATTISNVRNTFSNTSGNFRNGLGDDLPIKPRVADLNDTNTIDALEKALNLYRGTTDIYLDTKSVEGLEPYAEIVLPEGIDPGPLQWGEVMPDGITSNPLLDELLETGSIMLANNPKFGVDYRSAFEAARTQGGLTQFPTKSGKQITVTVNDEHISVTDAMAETKAQFWGSITPDGVLELGLYARGDDGNRYHDDLFASEFFLSTVDWFGLENIAAVDGAWSPLSTNIETVNKSLEQIYREGIITEEPALVVSIRKTFTAKMAARIGFTEIVIKDVTPDPNNPGKYLNMNVRFRRPSNPTGHQADPLPYYSDPMLVRSEI